MQDQDSFDGFRVPDPAQVAAAAAAAAAADLATQAMLSPLPGDRKRRRRGGGGGGGDDPSVSGLTGGGHGFMFSQADVESQQMVGYAEAGGVLRSSNRPMLNRRTESARLYVGVIENKHSTDVESMNRGCEFVRVFTLEVSHDLILFEGLLSMTLLRGLPGRAVSARRAEPQRRGRRGGGRGGGRGREAGRACQISLATPYGWHTF